MKEYKRGDKVFLNHRLGLVPGEVLRFSFDGPLDGEPYYEVRTADDVDHYPASQILPNNQEPDNANDSV
jgi:hypothetical protein